MPCSCPAHSGSPPGRIPIPRETSHASTASYYIVLPNYYLHLTPIMSFLRSLGHPPHIVKLLHHSTRLSARSTKNIIHKNNHAQSRHQS
jgi:hypothetical protein